MTLNEFGDVVVWILEVNRPSQLRIPCFFMCVPDDKYDTDYTQASGKVIHEYHHRRKGSFPFLDRNFWAETHGTEKDCWCFQNCIQNGRTLCFWSNRSERLRVVNWHWRKKNNVQLSKHSNSVPIIQELTCYHRGLRQFTAYVGVYFSVYCKL